MTETSAAALLVITYIPSISLWLPVKTKQLKAEDVQQNEFMKVSRPEHEEPPSEELKVSPLS